MCPACVQSMGIALLGLTSSTGLIALVMANRGTSKDAGTTAPPETTADETSQEEKHA